MIFNLIFLSLISKQAAIKINFIKRNVCLRTFRKHKTDAFLFF